MHAPLVAPSIAQYVIRRARAAPPLSVVSDHPLWRAAQIADINQFHSRSTDNRPNAQARVLYYDARLFIHFTVDDDRYVRCTQTQFQSPVCIDSCVEFFVQPRADKGYFNFELNAGGTLMVLYIEDPTLVEGDFRRFTPVRREHAEAVEIFHTLPAVIEPELPGPLSWRLALSVPVSFFEHYTGALGDLAGQTWRGNFYKCGDQTSHPHWASWSPINRKLSFHQPKYFGTLQFE